MVIGDIDVESAGSRADAAVAAHDFGACMVERGGCDIVREGAAMAGCFVCLGWCFDV